MTGALEPQLSNETPPVLQAVHAHYVWAARADAQRAQSRLRQAERRAVLAGIPMDALRHAMEVMALGPEKFERRLIDRQRLLASIKCGEQMEMTLALESTTDVGEDERQKIIWNKGYACAVQGYPRSGSGYADGDDIMVWEAGYDAFLRDLVDYEATQ